MQQLEEDAVNRVAAAGGIRTEEMRGLEIHMKTARVEYNRTLCAYKTLFTRKNRIEALTKVESAFADALNKLEVWHKFQLAHHEAITGKNGLQAAGEAVEADAARAHNLLTRLRQAVQHLEDQEKEPLTRDEQMAKASAAKPELTVLDNYIVSFWEMTGRPVRYGEESGFIKYFRAFDQEIPTPQTRDGEELAIETIRSRVTRMRLWLNG
jgi:hypothetical protein